MVEPTAPLAHRASDLVRLHATEVPFLSQIDVRCGTDAAARLGFPLEPNTVAGDMVRGVLWLGPDEWLVVGLPGTGPGVLAQLEAALTGSHASVVDTSANRAVIHLTGSLPAGPARDGVSDRSGSPRRLGAGRCAQTLFGRAPVLVQELVNATRIFVRPSFAEYVVDRLLAAAKVRS